MRQALLLLLCPLLLFSCATNRMGSSDYRAEGARDSRGLATGKWKVYHASDSKLVAVGSLSEGRLVGKWDYYIANGTRVAEIRFKDSPPNKGSLHGPYKLYYTGLDERGGEGGLAKGKLKTIGEAKEGFGDGRFVRYSHDGKVVVDYTANRDGITGVKTGSKEEALHQYRADTEYLSTLFMEAFNATR